MDKRTYADRRDYLIKAVADRRRTLKEKAVAFLGGACARCGYAKCVAALEFHHRDPKKKDFRIGSGNSKAWKTIMSELKKCDLLCANCHREAHFHL